MFLQMESAFGYQQHQQFPFEYKQNRKQTLNW